jgi:hypothetical protein
LTVRDKSYGLCWRWRVLFHEPAKTESYMKACKWAVILALGLILAGVASCGDDEDKKASPGGVLNPCLLVSQEEAAEALGVPVKAGQLKGAANPLGQSICIYEGQAEDVIRFVQISLVATQNMNSNLRESGYTAAKLFADSKKLLGKPKAVSGLGQEAFWGGSGLKAGSGLHVLSKDAYFNITVASGDAKRDLKAAKELVQKALKRLP